MASVYSWVTDIQTRIPFDPVPLDELISFPDQPNIPYPNDQGLSQDLGMAMEASDLKERRSARPPKPRRFYSDEINLHQQKPRSTSVPATQKLDERPSLQPRIGNEASVASAEISMIEEGTDELGVGSSAPTNHPRQRARSVQSDARSKTSESISGDLRFAEKSVRRVQASSQLERDQIPKDMQRVWAEMCELKMKPKKAMPQGFEGEIDCFSKESIEKALFSDPKKINPGPWAAALYDMHALNDIQNSTGDSNFGETHEPNWNDSVHSPMLHLAIHNRPKLKKFNITAAKICDEFLVKDGKGNSLPKKMIDYAIVVNPTEEQFEKLKARLLSLGGEETVNVTDYYPLCDRPIAILIETKATAGTIKKGQTQLELWVITYFKRLEALTGKPVSTIIPLILVQDSKWMLQFARNKETTIEIIDTGLFGNTQDLQGCYHTLTILRLLCDWAENEFSNWLSEYVWTL